MGGGGGVGGGNAYALCFYHLIKVYELKKAKSFSNVLCENVRIFYALQLANHGRLR